MKEEPQRALSLVVREAIRGNPRAWALVAVGLLAAVVVAVLALCRELIF